MTDPRRQLPAVASLLEDPALTPVLESHPRPAVVAAIRELLELARRARRELPEDWISEVRERLQAAAAPSLRGVINATGVVLHTNLGRAPLAPEALAAIAEVAGGYSTLEFELTTGARGRRDEHVRHLLAACTGAADGLVVNNAAGALVLGLNTLARGGRVLISRGELVEIGGSFRIPEILARSGALLQEVGTTNRTHLEDYRSAMDGAAAILTVHRSNFEQRGFVATPDPGELARLARAAGIPYLYDVGSGLLADLSPWGLTGEPRVQDAVALGADLVIFSGDKLLGGPQAGCLVGAPELVRLCRENPLARALRADKLTLAALAATLGLYQDPARAISAIPVLQMLASSAEELQRRAGQLASLVPEVFRPEIVPGVSAVGGGAFPGAELPTTLVVLTPGAGGAGALSLRLRSGTPPVVVRVERDRICLDPRTIPPASYTDLASVLAGAAER